MPHSRPMMWVTKQSIAKLREDVVQTLLKSVLVLAVIGLGQGFGTRDATPSAEADLQRPRLQLAQFSDSPPSGWPGTGTSGQRRASPPSRRPAPDTAAQPQVPLPSRRPAIDANAGVDTAPKRGLFVEGDRLREQDREPQQAGKATDKAEEATAVPAADDLVWLHCSESLESTDGGRQRRIQACTEILARSPAEPAGRRREALKSRAMAYGDFNGDLAIDDYTALLELDPDDTAILFRRSHQYVSQQKYDVAIADLDRIVALEPDKAEAFGERGRVYEQKGDIISAEKDYRKAIEIDSENREYISHLEGIIKSKSTENAEDNTKKSVVFGDDDELYNLCSNFSESPDKRIESCNAVVAKLPALEIEGAFFSAEKTPDLSKSIDKISVAGGYDLTWLRISTAIGLRGIAQYDKADMESAFVDINNAIDKAGRIIYRDGTGSTLDAMMLFRGRLFLKNEEYDRAEDDFRTVARVNLVPDGHSHLALLHFSRKQYDKAQEEIRIALKRDPENAMAFLVRGRISLEKGAHEQALQDCQRAVDVRQAKKQRVNPETFTCIEKAREALAAGAKPAESQQNSDKPE